MPHGRNPLRRNATPFGHLVKTLVPQDSNNPLPAAFSAHHNNIRPAMQTRAATTGHQGASEWPASEFRATMRPNTFQTLYVELRCRCTEFDRPQQGTVEAPSPAPGDTLSAPFRHVIRNLLCRNRFRVETTKRVLSQQHSRNITPHPVAATWWHRAE